MNGGEPLQPELDAFEAISVEIKEQYVKPADTAWDRSPFGWIKGKAPRSKGKIGEHLIKKWCEQAGLRVAAPHNTGHDLMVENVRVEVKFSMLWAKGHVVFQQIRDQDYDIVVCLGIAPNDVRLWVIPKQVLQERPEGVKPQHGGEKGRDTLWLRVNFGDPPRWLGKYGGTLREGTAVLMELVHSREAQR